MKQIILAAVCVLIVQICFSCDSKKNPEQRTYENSYESSSTVTGETPYVDNSSNRGETSYNEKQLNDNIENNPYINNSLRTGVSVYPNEKSFSGSDSKITVSTSAESKCDVVIILRSDNLIVKNVYLKAGDSYSFNIPNGYYQVFFYGGRGWNPNKTMANAKIGGFVVNESYSKDSPVLLTNQELNYELIPQANGNFSTQQSSLDEMF